MTPPSVGEPAGLIADEQEACSRIAAVPPSKIPLHRRVLYAGLAIGLVFTCIAVLVEVGLRLALPLHFDDRWHHPMRPGSYTFTMAFADVPVEINARGLRGPLLPLDRRPDVPRVLAIGDSTTWGEGVRLEETWPEVAARLTAQQMAIDEIEVVNVSKPGAGVLDYAIYWDRIGRAYSPDVVLIGFFMGNDMFSAVDPYRVEVAEPGARAPSFFDRVQGSVLGRARLIRQLTDRLRPPITIIDLLMGEGIHRSPSPVSTEWLSRRARERGVELAVVEGRLASVEPELRQMFEAYELDAWLLAAAVLNPDSMRESQELTRPEILEAWRVALERLIGVTDDIRASGAEPIVVAIPRAVQVSERYHDEYRALGWNVPSSIAHSTAPQELLTSELRARGVRVLDPLPALRARDAESNQRQFFEYDVHMNAVGNRNLGELIAPAIEEALRRH